MNKPKKYTIEDFTRAINESQSLRSTLIKLGVQPHGGNYRVAKRRIKLLGLDISHFTGQAHLGGKSHDWSRKTPTEEILVKDSKYGGSSSSLRPRLIREGYFERKCYECKRTKWNGKDIPLELEHKNGDSFDHRLDNLTLLCPNCHALTLTYRGRNIKADRKPKPGGQGKVKNTYICNNKNCNLLFKSLAKKRKYCSYKCSHEVSRKVMRPTKEELIDLIKERPMTQIGKQFGVSDNAIRKWAKQYDIL